MNQSCLRGIELRYVLTMQLAHHGPATVTELIDAIHYQGFRVQGRPSKAVPDALRWEIEHGRVHRLGRGRHGPAYVPRSTDYRIHQTRVGPASGRCRAEVGKMCAASSGIRKWRV